MNDIIDQVISDNIDYDNCANVILPTPFGWKESAMQVPSIEFKWPAAPIVAQKEIISEYVAEYKKLGIRIDVYLDTTRGCPYKCTFCDWGGSEQKLV